MEKKSNKKMWCAIREENEKHIDVKELYEHEIECFRDVGYVVLEFKSKDAAEKYKAMMETKDVINYFKSFDEGDNITITCDFIMNIDYLIKCIETLQERIDKAIEYIEEKVGNEIHDMMYVIDVSDVLDILQGEDNE